MRGSDDFRRPGFPLGQPFPEASRLQLGVSTSQAPPSPGGALATLSPGFIKLANR